MAPFAAVRDRIENSLVAERRHRLEEQFKSELLSQARIQRHPELLVRVPGLQVVTNPAARDASPLPTALRNH